MVFHSEDGSIIATPADAPSSNEVLQPFYGKNVIFLSKQDMLDEINRSYPTYHAIAVVKSFPNKLTVHLVDRVAVYKVGNVYVDSFGYIVDEPANQVIDVSGAFSNVFDVVSTKVGTKLAFNNNQKNDAKFDLMLQAVNAVWQLNYSYQDIPKLIASFSFEEKESEQTMTILTKTGVKIVVYSPSVDLSTRLHLAFSVYYNEINDVTKEGSVIYVPQKGNITTSFEN
ncbi:MAG: hypothetical protein IKC47_05205 [Clostridia bacterium]|nr:hypothetical protein [Clostridia bacterium]